MQIEDFTVKMHELSTEKLIKLRDVASEDLLDLRRQVAEAQEYLDKIVEIIIDRAAPAKTGPQGCPGPQGPMGQSVVAKITITGHKPGHIHQDPPMVYR